MIQRLNQLTAELVQDATRAGPDGRTFVDVNAHLMDLYLAGDIQEGLMREDATRAGISPVQQLLAHSGIRLSGLHAHTMDVFADNAGRDSQFSGATVLFPALAQEWLYQGLGMQASDGFTSSPSRPGDTVYPTEVRTLIDQRDDVSRRVITLDELVSITFGISGDQYKTAVIKKVDSQDFEASRVVEGTEPPLYTITTAERSVNFYKYGTRIKATYEALRRSRIDKVQLLVSEMSKAEKRRLIKEALAVAMNGDGNGNGAIISPTVLPAVTAQALDEWLMDMAYTDAPDINRVVADLASVKKVRALRYPVANQAMTPDQYAMYGGDYTMPDGTPLRLALKGSVLDNAKVLLGFNTGRALEQVIENGSQIQETQRWINNQTQEWVQTINTGFGKPYEDSFVGVSYQ